MIIYDIAQHHTGWRIESLRAKRSDMELLARDTNDWLLIINQRGNLAVAINTTHHLFMRVAMPQVTKGMKRDFIETLYRNHLKNAFGVAL
jgi:hypothetical protein